MTALFAQTWAGMAIGMMAAVVGALVALSMVVAIQARWRGYSLWVWLVVCVVSVNPIFFLVLLAVMPDFARKNLRKTEMEDLELALKMRTVSGPAGPIAARGPIDRSLGDQPTTFPERSIGDDATRL